MQVDAHLDELVDLIRDTFRIREDHRPLYIDVAGHLSRLSAFQHQVVFGRRGSGKSSLLLHHHFSVADTPDRLSIYLSTDEIKRLPFPDILIRLLLAIFEAIAGATQTGRRRRSSLLDVADELRNLLSEATTRHVTEETRAELKSSVEGMLRTSLVSAGGNRESLAAEGTTSEFVEEKLAVLEKRLQDYKDAIRTALLDSGLRCLYVILDDFYLIQRPVQPDVIDYLHRLLRGTPAYLKVGTVRHRTALSRREEQFIGVEPFQDVEEIDLDYTFQNIEATTHYLREVVDAAARQVGLSSFTESYLEPEVLYALVVASGGVPRDFLNILVEVLTNIRRETEPLITLANVRDASGRHGYLTKFLNLHDDVGRDEAGTLEFLFYDLRRFCLQELRRTVFLVMKDETVHSPQEYDLLLQLMDFKLIHIVSHDVLLPDRPGRVTAFALDYSTYSSLPIDEVNVVDFRRMDTGAWSRGITGAPVYPLTRAAIAVGRRDVADRDGTDENVNANNPASSAITLREGGGDEADVDPKAGESSRPLRKRLPQRRRSNTFNFHIADAEGHVTVGEYDDGSPGEIFVKFSKQGSTLAGVLDSFSIAVSLGLQYGVPLRHFVQTFSNMRFQPAGRTNDPDLPIASSVIDYIFRRLALDYLPLETRQEMNILGEGERVGSAGDGEIASQKSDR